MAKSRITEEIDGTDDDDIEVNEDEQDADLETDDESEAKVETEDTDDEEASDDESDASTDEDGEDDEGDEEEDEDESEESDILTVSIGDEKTKPDDKKEPAPKWVKDLRKSNRALTKRNKELEAQAKSTAAPEKVLGIKPTLESSGHDADVYEKKLTEWLDKGHEIEANKEEENKVKEKIQEEHSAKYTKYNTDKAALKVPDFDEAEDIVIDILSETQQGALLQGSGDPALLVYALGKNEAKVRELAKIEDPVKFIFALSKVEAQLKVSNGKPKPKPEGRLRGSGKSGNALDSKLERLRKDAEKTGDFTKVIAYKTKLRSAN